MKRHSQILILILLLLMPHLMFSTGRPPLFIKQETEIFKNIAREITRRFPKNISLLNYDIILINGSPEQQKRINKLFIEVLRKNSNTLPFHIQTIDEIDLADKNIDTTFLKRHDEIELIAFGKILELDGVIIATLTILEETKRKIWDKDKRKWIQSDVALFQGNIFNTEDNSSMLRFSHYFTIK